ncbi:GntR family transcriptional regulator [Streptomyces niveus]|uniref:GntR family transcriptional regulator n=1 Tax=Streptomyces niveus TaxID=193462 RepID=UPI003652A544
MTFSGRWSAHRIADDLRNHIQNGEFAPDGRLPSTQELVSQYKSSAVTVRQAVQRLKNMGLVTSQTGVGVYARRIDPIAWRAHRSDGHGRGEYPNGDVDDWTASIEELGRVPSYDAPEVTVELVEDDIASWLDIEAGTFAVVQRCLRRVDGVPHQLVDIWFPKEIAIDSPLMKPSGATMDADTLAGIGPPQVRRRRLLRGWLPTEEEIGRLELDADAANPVLRHVLVSYDAANKPVRCEVTIAPGDRNLLVLDDE